MKKKRVIWKEIVYGILIASIANTLSFCGTELLHPTAQSPPPRALIVSARIHADVLSASILDNHASLATLILIKSTEPIPFEPGKPVVFERGSGITLIANGTEYEWLAGYSLAGKADEDEREYHITRQTLGDVEFREFKALDLSTHVMGEIPQENVYALLICMDGIATLTEVSTE